MSLGGDCRQISTPFWVKKERERHQQRKDIKQLTSFFSRFFESGQTGEEYGFSIILKVGVDKLGKVI